MSRRGGKICCISASVKACETSRSTCWASFAAEPEELDEKAVYHRGERPTGYNARSIRMPRNANLDNIKARYQDGVLIIEVPKKEVSWWLQGTRKSKVASAMSMS